MSFSLLRDPELGRRLSENDVSEPKNLTIIVDEGLLRRAELLVAKELGGGRQRTRMAGAVINQGLRALLRQRASKRLATMGGTDADNGRSARRSRAG